MTMTSLPPAPPAPTALQQFLATGPACPGCGYDLRAAPDDTCPECGERVALSLVGAHPFWRQRGLLALVLLWLVLAGGMNATRLGRSIHATATRQQIQQLALMGNALPLVGNTFRTARPNVEATEITATWTLAAPDSAAAPALARRPAITIATTTTPARWGAVTWTQWSTFGAWTILALLAATGLGLLLRHRRAAPPPRVARAVRAIAWIGFAGYFAYHGWRFATEWV